MSHAPSWDDDDYGDLNQDWGLGLPRFDEDNPNPLEESIARSAQEFDEHYNQEYLDEDEDDEDDVEPVG